MEDNMWVGYRFTPTDEVLVCHFLFNKFLDHESYCFVRVCRSKKAGDERSERKARGGTWIALDKPHEILRVDGRAVAGSRRSFKFFVDIDDPTKSEEGKRVATGWMMHEYRLHPSMYPPQYKEDEEMILCRIRQGKQIRGQRQQPSSGGFTGSRTGDRHTGLNTNPNAVASLRSRNVPRDL
ncbi:uncharacterized protein LOC135631558 [Musa acuminata AAA Group]|uniref:uncharacterized protein LOC135631558 n=1 Tax=Musa acuminata AAA Group TaxID=214697 RepID=UPI0031D6B7D5